MELGMQPHLIKRHPFPGPGLGIRILGDITPEKVRILQEADDIYMSLMREWGLYDKIWQAGVILLPIQSVGVMGDERTYENTVALRAVTSTDAMTADWAQLPYEFLAKVSNEIINKVKGVNRVVYDISSKPALQQSSGSKFHIRISSIHNVKPIKNKESYETRYDCYPGFGQS